MNSPTLSTHRIESLDLIRGIGICGIVMTNSIEQLVLALVLVVHMVYIHRM